MAEIARAAAEKAMFERRCNSSCQQRRPHIIYSAATQRPQSYAHIRMQFVYLCMYVCMNKYMHLSLLQVMLRQTLQVAIATTTPAESATSVELRIMASG